MKSKTNLRLPSFFFCVLFGLFLGGFSILSNTNAAQSQDFILLDTTTSATKGIGQTLENQREESGMIDIQRIGESQDFIESDFYCGNERKERIEKCDQNDFGGKKCSDFGFSEGILKCSNDCFSIDTSQCFNPTPTPSLTPDFAISVSSNSQQNNASGGGGKDPIIIAQLSSPNTESIPNTDEESESYHRTPEVEVTKKEDRLISSIPPQHSSPTPEKTIIPPTEKEEPPKGSLIEFTPSQYHQDQNKNEEITPNSKTPIPQNNSDTLGANPHSTPTMQTENIEFKTNNEPQNLKSAPPEPVVSQNYNKDETLPCWIYLILAFLIGFFLRHVMGYFTTKNKIKNAYTPGILVFCIGVSTILFGYPTQAFTPEIPNTLIYEGRMLSKTSTPLSGDYTMRFSFWNTADALEGEQHSDGSIDTTSNEYSGWQEELPVTFTEQGYFSLILGEQNTISDISLAKDKYLQVEIKQTSAPDTDYQILDVDIDDDTKDRKKVASLPYAFNARESVLSETAKQADGSSSNTFILDPENTVENAGIGTIELQFGGTLEHVLGYDFARNIFTFSDSIEVQGDISIVSDSGSATFTAQNLTGDHTYTLPDQDAYLVDTTSTQILENKTIDASNNTIINLDTSSLAPSQKTQVIHPLFPNTVFQAESSNNQVSVFMGEESNAQYYKVSTHQNTLQQGSFIITLPLEEFDSFDNGEISFLLKTKTNLSSENFIDITVKDVNGIILQSLPTQTTGGIWETKIIDMNEVDPLLEKIIIEINTSVSNGNPTYISTIKAKYMGK